MKDFNKISDFIDGTLSSAEQAEFEQSITSDPKLKAEVNRQQMLVEGIKAARHNQLKTRLAAIPVTAGIAMRTKIAVGVAAVFTAGLTFFGHQELTKAPVNTNTTTTEQTIEAPQRTVVIKTIPNTAPISSKEEVLIPEKPVTEASKAVSTVNTKTNTDKNSNDVSPDMIFTPSFDENQNVGVQKSNGSKPNEVFSNEKAVTKTMILPKIEESKTLQYLYYNDKLTLFGDFSAEEYLVLDYRHINKVFLYFNDSFYELRVGKRKSSLKSSLVTDLNLKAQLRAELQD